MHRKCYTHTTERLRTEDEKDTFQTGKWRPLTNLSPGLVMMVRHSAGNEIKFAPLYLHSFRLVQPHFLAEAEKFNVDYIDAAQPTTTADKLRYYRHQKGLLQREVADYAGIDRGTYSGYEETGVRDYYPLDKLTRIAELLEAPLENLLDDYNAFLYYGQGRQVTELRQSMGLTRKEFAARYGVWTTTVRDWEVEAVRLTKATWEKLFL